MKSLSVLAGLALAASGAFAAPAKTPSQSATAKPAAKRITLNYCAMTGEKLGKHPIGATTYKGYNIAFCCNGCPQQFAKLSAKEKDAKVAAIAQKQAKAPGAKTKA